MEGHGGYMDGSRYYGEGLPINTWYMRQYAGVSEEGLSMWYYTDKETGEKKTTTTNSSADYYLCGDPNPDLYGGFGTTLNVYGFDLSAQFSYTIGGKTYDSDMQASWLIRQPQASVTAGTKTSQTHGRPKYRVKHTALVFQRLIHHQHVGSFLDGW